MEIIGKGKMPDRASLEEAEVRNRAIAKVIQKMIPKGWVFTLVLCSVGEGGFSTYVSNIKRDDSIKMMGEMVMSMIDKKEI